MGDSNLDAWLASIEDIQSLLNDAIYAYVNDDDEWVVASLETVEDRFFEIGQRDNANLVARYRREVEGGVDGPPAPPAVFEGWIDTLDEAKADAPTSELE